MCFFIFYYVCVCMMYACVRFPPSQAIPIEALIIKLGMVTASNMVMHHVLTILTLTFIEGHTDLNHE